MREKEKNLQRLQEVLNNPEITEQESKSVKWLAGWESETVDNIYNAIEKTNHKHQELLLNWAKVAVKELDKLDNDRSTRVLRDGGKALIKEIGGK